MEIILPIQQGWVGVDVGGPVISASPWSSALQVFPAPLEKPACSRPFYVHRGLGVLLGIFRRCSSATAAFPSFELVTL